MAVYQQDNVNLVFEGEPQQVSAARVTQAFFDVLGIQPASGRTFAAGEDRQGAEPVAVLGYGLWERSFGADPTVVGRVVEMDGEQRRIVGVMPEGFAFPSDVELWRPISIDDTDPDHGSFGLLGIGRMAGGSTVDEVNREMDALVVRFAATQDDLSPQVIEQAGIRADAKPLKELFVADLAQALWVVLGTVGFVLLIACANVANLFLVRAEARQREQALRAALGATRADMVRYYLTESVALGVGGGALGLGLAAIAIPLLLGVAPEGMPRMDEVGIDRSVLMYTAAISVLSGLLFGLFPVLSYARRDLSASLKEGGRAATAGRARHRTRGALVVSQVALALVLLVASGLMARSFAAMRSVDPGFDAQGRLVFGLSLPSAEYPDRATARTFYAELREQLAAVPGVEEVGFTFGLPLTGSRNASSLEPEDRPRPEGDLGPLVNLVFAGPGYLSAMGIELVEGRELTDEDAADRFRGVVVSERLAREFWPGEGSVLGRRIRGQGDGAEGWEVVGVARDTRFESLSADPSMMAYLPLVYGDSEAETVVRSVSVVLWVSGDPLDFLSAARERLRAVDPRLPAVDPRALESVVREASASTSFTLVVLGIAAAIALLLGAVGIYGVISYVVSQRTQEIGVRMALGAPRGLVMRGVIGQGMALTAVGVVLGLVGAWVASRSLAALLYGVSADDPITYVATAVVLTCVALAASALPAWRAAKVDPLQALRSD
jgi:predicted permease